MGNAAEPGLVRARALVAMVHVANVARSIAFYAHLGFEVRGEHVPEGASERSWASLECDGAQLMLARWSAPVVPEQQAVLFYLYLDDVAAAHDRLAALGLAPGPIRFPFFNPGGEFRLVDPDGYCVMVAHT